MIERTSTEKFYKKVIERVIEELQKEGIISDDIIDSLKATWERKLNESGVMEPAKLTSNSNPNPYQPITSLQPIMRPPMTSPQVIHPSAYMSMPRPFPYYPEAESRGFPRPVSSSMSGGVESGRIPMERLMSGGIPLYGGYHPFPYMMNMMSPARGMQIPPQAPTLCPTNPNPTSQGRNNKTATGRKGNRIEQNDGLGGKGDKKRGGKGQRGLNPALNPSLNRVDRGRGMKAPRSAIPGGGIGREKNIELVEDYDKKLVGEEIKEFPSIKESSSIIKEESDSSSNSEDDEEVFKQLEKKNQIKPPLITGYHPPSIGITSIETSLEFEKNINSPTMFHPGQIIQDPGATFHPIIPPKSSLNPNTLNQDDDDDEDQDMESKTISLQPKKEDIFEEIYSDEFSDSDDEDDAENTQDMILGQWVKINRTKTKWKCVFRDVVLHINNTDYICNKGTAEITY